MEMGGVNTGQIIDNVKAYEPRGWSCLHAIGKLGKFFSRNVRGRLHVCQFF